MLLFAAVAVTACLSLVLVVILYKLYQTYQPPYYPYQDSNTSIHTLLSTITSQPEPCSAGIAPTELVVTTYGGPIRKSQTLHLPTKDTSTSERLSMSAAQPEPVHLCEENLESFHRNDITEREKPVQNYHYGFSLRKKTTNNPPFQEKWQFPKCKHKFQQAGAELCQALNSYCLCMCMSVLSLFKKTPLWVLGCS